MLKPYKRALITGRFQTFHVQHLNNILKAFNVAEKVLIVVGSAQESGTERNPFSASLRKIVLEEAIKGVKYEGADIFSAFFNQSTEGNIKVTTLNDYTHELDFDPAWGSYLLDHATEHLGGRPDLFVCGDDGAEHFPALWFSPEDRVGLNFLQISRAPGSISATKMRGLMLLNKEQEWRAYAPEATHRYYDLMREELLKIPFYQQKLAELKG